MKKFFHVFFFICNFCLFAQTYVQIGTGTGEDIISPMNYNWQYGWTAMLYEKSEINAAGYNQAGYLKEIQFNVANNNFTLVGNQKIYICETNVNVLTSQKPSTDTMTLVFEGEIDWRTTGWVSLAFNKNLFYYTNTKNLLVYFEHWDGKSFNGAPLYKVTYYSAYKVSALHQNNNFPPQNSTGYLFNNRPNIKFHFSDSQNMTYVQSRCFHYRDFVGAYSIIDSNVILKLRIDVAGISNPFQISSISFSLANSTNWQNVKKAKLLYTTSSKFVSPQVISQINVSSENFTFSSVNKQLQTGANYFWLAVELDTNAADGTIIDVTCTGFVATDNNQQRTPENSNPTGVIVIKRDFAACLDYGTLSDFRFPMNFRDFKFGWTGLIYAKEEIGWTSEDEYAYIYEIAFYVENDNSINVNKQKIYMSHTNLSEIQAVKPNSDTMTLVFEGAINYSQKGWKIIKLQTPFKYYKNKNLFLLYEHWGNLENWWFYPTFKHHRCQVTRTSSRHMDERFPTSNDGAYLNYERPDIVIVYKKDNSMRYHFSCVFSESKTIISPYPKTDKILNALQVSTFGTKNPFSMNNIKYNFSGTTNLSNIKKAKVYYTSTRNFTNTTLLAETAAIQTELTFNVNKQLQDGLNYFWLAIELDTNAQDNSIISAICTEFFATDSNKTRTPTQNSDITQWLIKNADLLYKTGNLITKLTPFFYEYSYGWSMFMVKKDEIREAVGEGQRRIASIAFELIDNPNFVANVNKVYVAHWNGSQLPSTRPNPDTMFLAYSGNLNLDKKGWFTIDLQYPFVYNNQDNLLFYFERRNGNTKNNVFYSAHSDNPGCSEYWGWGPYVFDGRVNWNYRPDFCLVLKDPNEMTYANSTTENVGEEYQPTSRNTNGVKASRLKVFVYGFKNPFKIDTIAVSLNGTTNLSDIKKISLYYTTVPFFSAQNLFGYTTVINDTVIKISGSQLLQQGNNYFWITVDVDTASQDENIINVGCKYFVTTDFNIRREPMIQDPAGHITIIRPLGGKYLIKAGEKFETLTKAFRNMNIAGIYSNVELELNKSEYSQATGEVFPLKLSYANAKYSPYKITITNAQGQTAEIKSPGDYVNNIIIESTSNVEIKAKQKGEIKISSFKFNAEIIKIKAAQANDFCRNIAIENCELNGHDRYYSIGINICGWDQNESGGGHRNIRIEGNVFKKVKSGVLVKNDYSEYKNDTLEIIDNVFGDDNIENSVGNFPINISLTENIVIERNNIKNINLNSSQQVAGLRLYKVKKTKIISNKLSNFYNSWPVPLEVDGIDLILETNSSEILIANNIMEKFGGNISSFSIYGVKIGNKGGVKIVNNTITFDYKFNDDRNVELRSAPVFVGENASNLIIKNNIFINKSDNLANNGRYTAVSIISNASKEAYVEINRNIYCAEAKRGYIGYLNGYAETIEEWRIKTQQDSHSYGGSVSINQEHKPLYSSIAYQTGLRDAEVLNDYYGMPRANNCAIGAVESYYDITAKPNAAKIIYPLNNQIGVEVNPSLAWQSAYNAIGYKLYLGTDNPPGNIIDGSDLGAKTRLANLSGLEENRTYYWKVVPYNNNGESDTVAIWSFSTGSNSYETPRFENFDLTTPPLFPSGWDYSSDWRLISDANKIFSAPNALQGLFGSSSNFVIMPPIRLNKNIEYEIEFMYKTQGKAYLEAKLGYSKDNFNILTIINATLDNRTSFERYSAVFEVPTDSLYYIRFTLKDGPENSYIYIDNIKLRIKPTYKYSGYFYNADFTKRELGSSGFYVQFTTPNSGKAKYTIEKIPQRPRGALPTGLTNIANMHWIVTIDSGSIDGVFDIEIDVDRAQIPGVIDISKINLLKRENSFYPWTDKGRPNSTLQRKATWTGFSGFSEFAIASDASNPLPVELKSFDAKCNGRDVVLRIKFADYSSLSYCEVLRMKEGENAWKVVSILERESIREKETLISDSKLSSGRFMYRLKMYEIDGSSKYSDIVEVFVENPKMYSLEQNYPNPFNPSTTIEYAIPEKAKVKIELYDITGRLIAILAEEEKESGYYSIVLDANQMSLKSGIYFYRMTAQIDGQIRFSKVFKMALVK